MDGFFGGKAVPGKACVRSPVSFLRSVCITSCLTRLFTKALGVLEEQGVYALFLYLHAREKEWGKKTSTELATFLREQPSKQNALLGTSNNNELFDALQQLATDLDKLLFARDLLHRALVYARYHAKAAHAGTQGTP